MGESPTKASIELNKNIRTKYARMNYDLGAK